MGKYLKKFQTTAQYNAYTADTANFIKPNVSLIEETNTVEYNPDSAKPITDAIITCDSATYNGQTQVATNIVVTLSGETLISGTDYTVSNNEGGINAGNYTFTVNGIGNYGGSKNGTFIIGKVTPTVTVPTAKVLTYNGSAQELVNGGSTDFGTLKYSLDDSEYSISLPSGTNATSYTVYYRVDGDSNINDVAAQSVGVTIAKVTPTVVIPVAKVLTYQKGVAQELVTAGSTNYGTMKYSTDGETYSASVPSKTKAGSYTVYYFVEGDSNVNSTDVATVACSINEKPVTATIELSEDTYTYDGSAKEPTVTVKDGGDVIDPSEYTVTYSNNTNAGTASVTITDNTAGDYNVSGVTTFTINKASRTMSWVSSPSEVVIGNTITVEAAPSVGDGIITYSSSDTTKATVNGNVVSGVSVGNVTITATIAETTNYLSASTSYSLTIENRVVAKFNVTSTSSPTKIVNKTDGFSEIEIDGVQTSVVSAYTFDTIGEHTVKYTLTDPTSIGNLAFFQCYGLTSIVIPNSVTSIGSNAFSDCTGLTSCTIGSGVTSIGGSAFKSCRSLTSITIPSSVTSIGSNVILYCSGLTSIVSNATTAPTIKSSTFQNTKTGGTLYVPIGSSGYDVWMGTGDYYLGKYGWTKVEQ